MELDFDWRKFQALFYPQKKSTSEHPELASKPIFLLKEGECVKSAFAENESLLEWIGKTEKEISEDSKFRQLLFLENKKVDQWLEKSTQFPNYYDQLEYLQSQVKGSFFSKHFFLECVEGWWGKLLPSSYGVFFRFTDLKQKDFAIVMKRDKITHFQEPDLSSLSQDRYKDTPAVVKYLSERYLVPFQGVSLTFKEWETFENSKEPWKKIALSIRSGQIKLYPFRWRLILLMATRAFLGF